jgi:hypothetical protein
MKNKTVDFDVLLEWINKNTFSQHNEALMYDYEIVYSDKLIRKINELATPNLPQESIFDADGWCWDMSLVPKNDKIEVIVIDLASSKKETEIIDSDSINFYIEFIKYIADVHDKQSEFEELKFGWRPLPKLPNGGDNG